MRESKDVACGGLFRCCLQTLAEYDGPETEGTALRCKWCSESMIVDGRVWRWNKNG